MAKICFYCVATHLGGAERSLLEFISHVHNQGHDKIDVLVPKADGPLLTELERLGVRYRVLPMPAALLEGSRQKGGRLGTLLATFRWDFWRYLFRLRSDFRRESPSVIYTTGIKCHLLAAWVVSGLGIPVFWHLRDAFRAGPLRTAFLFLYRVHPAVHAVANSRATAQSLSPRWTPAVVYNGVDPETFEFCRRHDLHEELALSPHTKIVGIVGVLAEWKGQEAFLRMAAKIAARRSDVHFIIAGDQIYDTRGEAGYRSRLLRLTAELGIEDRVDFLGFRNGPARLMQSLDVLVHASLRPEPFGRVIIEAMACGTPITASAAGGPLEILRKGKDGMLHEPGNVEQMARNVEFLLDPLISKNIVREAHSRFLDKFTHRAYRESLSLQLESVKAIRSNS